MLSYRGAKYYLVYLLSSVKTLTSLILIVDSFFPHILFKVKSPLA